MPTWLWIALWTVLPFVLLLFLGESILAFAAEQFHECRAHRLALERERTKQTLIGHDCDALIWHQLDSVAERAAELRFLLERVAAVLDDQLSPAEGGAWEVYALAEEVRRAQTVEPPAAGHRLQRERLAARRCIRAATALVVALREHDMPRVRKCVTVFEDANQAFEAVSQRDEGNLESAPESLRLNRSVSIPRIPR